MGECWRILGLGMAVFGVGSGMTAEVSIGLAVAEDTGNRESCPLEQFVRHLTPVADAEREENEDCGDSDQRRQQHDRIPVRCPCEDEL